MSQSPKSYTPPLGQAELTPLYDAAIALLTREGKWRRALVAEVLAGPHASIIDIGAGTGSLALLIHGAAPRSAYTGVDPDSAAIKIARLKAERAGSGARFVEGFFPQALPDEPADVIVSSLVLHQVSLDEKRRIITAAFERLHRGGRLLIADYGLQDSALARFLFRSSVQSLDGVDNTQPNADGVLPAIMREVGFAVEERAKYLTPTGVIYIHAATRNLLPRRVDQAL